MNSREKKSGLCEYDIAATPCKGSFVVLSCKWGLIQLQSKSLSKDRIFGREFKHLKRLCEGFTSTYNMNSLKRF